MDIHVLRLTFYPRRMFPAAMQPDLDESPLNEWGFIRITAIVRRVASVSFVLRNS